MNESRADWDRSKKVWIGVDIGGTKTAVVMSVEPPSILARAEFPTLPDQGPRRAQDLIKKTIVELQKAQCICSHQVAAIGVSCGGPLDRIAGVIQSPPNLPTWVDVPITSILQSEFQVDCKLQNDANAGAVAEYRFGAGRGTENMVFLTMGTGMGAGIILNGQLYHGACDLAGEIGHVRLSRSGPVGHNKAGSVEGWASGGGMAELAIREAARVQKRGEFSSIARALSKNRTITAKEIAVLAQDGDPLAKRIIRTCGRRLGEALAILVDVLNPERIVIGGLAMRLGQDLLGPALSTMKREALAASAKHCEVVSAALGEKIGDVAAICVAQGL